MSLCSLMNFAANWYFNLPARSYYSSADKVAPGARRASTLAPSCSFRANRTKSPPPIVICWSCDVHCSVPLQGGHGYNMYVPGILIQTFLIESNIGGGGGR